MNNKGNLSFYEETNIPADTINCIQITTNNSLFCTTSWDGDVRCYGLNYNGTSVQSALKTKINIGVPATSCCWTPDNSQIIIGGADGKVYLWNVTSGSMQPQQISQHNNAIISTTFNQSSNCLIEGSIDGDIRAFDIRSPQQCMNLKPINCMTALCTSITNKNFAFSNGTESYQCTLENVSQPFDSGKETSGDIVTCLCYSPTRFFVAGMTNGIVRVKYTNSSDSKDGKDLRFRIGRKDSYQYACSCVAVHNPTEAVLTAADDESLTLWDCISRSKLSVYEPGVRSNPYSITACSYSQDGNILIYSKGYNWNFGYPGTIKTLYKCHYDNKLIIRLHQLSP